ncbi:acyl-CoA thioesterase [Halorarius litoreus]|uniref:acyl-CoA thioesterase n=1 Tax=Halorarius litoreus TaxID=2962676 RepID=UPI0020CEB5B1|nr:thioesterase family protein [Halorarius litoreus]
MEGFNHHVDISLRYRDLDPMNHVNNAVYASFLEQARTAYFRDVLDARLDEEEMVIADVEIQFERPMTMADDPARIHSRVPSLGTSSFPIEYAVTAGGERKATGETTLVCYDSENASSRPIPDDWRERIASFEGFSDS